MYTGSSLSNIGSRVLRMEDKDVYNQQRARFDIVSLQPVGHAETIKQYPKFTLEDKDAYYFRKMIKAEFPTDRAKVSRKEEKDDTAGRCTYDGYKSKVPVELW
jgi:hypothetical protein